MTREPVASGQFYPRLTKDLEEIIQRFTPRIPAPVAARGIILPHAGYVYSGPVAVATVSQVLARKRILILGPNHTGAGAKFALWPGGSWKIPSGAVAIDTDLAKAILARGDLIREDILAHTDEHSIEVELPILHHFFGDFKFVPIACKIESLEAYQKVAEQICAAVKSIKDDIFFVASTDLTHYEPDPAARKKDRAVIESIVNLDEKGLIDKVRQMDISMCGQAPVAIFIACLKELGARKSYVALYQTSGDTGGDYSSVVGYVGMVIK